MNDKEKIDKKFENIIPEIEYFLNANLSSLLNGYVPPKESKQIPNKEADILDDDFFKDVDKHIKF